MDEMGELVSAFVEERVDSPAKGEIDLWCEAVYAGLFSVGLHTVLRMKEVTEGPDKLDEIVNALIASTTRHAAPWMSNRLGARQGYPEMPPIRIELGPVMSQRLVVYFNEAIGVMADRGYALETARSHAVFAVLGQIIEEMIKRGMIRTAEKAIAFKMNVIEACDAMSKEVVKALEKRRGR